MFGCRSAEDRTSGAPFCPIWTKPSARILLAICDYPFSEMVAEMFPSDFAGLYPTSPMSQLLAPIFWPRLLKSDAYISDTISRGIWRLRKLIRGPRAKKIMSEM